MDRYNTYIGARYVPIFSGDWDNTKKYEPLEIVSYQGDSYTSKTYVPTGVDITNETYWAKTGNYNAQVEQLYHQVVNMGDRVDDLDLDVQELSDNIQGYDTHFTEIDSHLGALDTRCNNIEQRITNEVTRIDGVTDNLDDKIDTEVERLEEEISQLQGGGGFVTPEMYGAVGDGVTVDNVALNACFADAVAKKLMVIGQGTYLVDDSTTTIDGRKGVLVPAPVSMYNMNFILKSGVASNTNILTCKYGTGTYRIIGCKFSMNVTDYPVGSYPEYGAIHAIMFMYNSATATSYNLGYGNAEINGCEFENIWSYAIYAIPTDACLTVENCKFSVSAGAIAPGFSNFSCNNCVCTKNNNRDFIANFIFEKYNFTGSTTVVKNMSVNNVNIYNNVRLLRIDSTTMSNVKYGCLKFDNCMTSGVSGSEYIIDVSPTDSSLGAFSSLEELLFFNSCVNDRIKIQCYNARTVFINCNVGLVQGEDRYLLFDHCYMRGVNSLVHDLLSLSNCVSIATNYVLSSENIEITLESDACDTVVIDNLVQHINADYVTLIKDFAFKKCIINGLSTRIRSTQTYGSTYMLANNSNIDRTEFTSNLYVQSADMSAVTNTTIVNYINNVVLRYFGPAFGSQAIMNYTNKGVKNLWYD